MVKELDFGLARRALIQWGLGALLMGVAGTLFAQPSTSVADSSATPCDLTFEYQYQPPNCDGTQAASISFQAKGGTPPYAYSIDGGNQFDSQIRFAGIRSGKELRLLVRDSQDCQSSVISFRVEAPRSVDFSVKSLPPTCDDGADGRISVQAAKSPGTLEYTIDGGYSFQPGALFKDLPAGFYQVGARMYGSDCPIELQDVELKGTSRLVAELMPPSGYEWELNCPDSEDGALRVKITEGTPPYQYQWSTGGEDPTLKNLAPGAYQLTLTDARGCVTELEATLDAPKAFEVAVPDCRSLYRGYGQDTCLEIGVDIEGNGSYQYEWSTGDQTAYVQVCPSNSMVYAVRVTNDRGCVVWQNVPVKVVDVGCGMGKVWVNREGEEACVADSLVSGRMEEGWSLGQIGSDPCSSGGVGRTPAVSAGGFGDGNEALQSQQPLYASADPDPIRIAPIREVVTPLEDLPAFLRPSGGSRVARLDGSADIDPEVVASWYFDTAPGLHPVAFVPEMPSAGGPSDVLGGQFDPSTRMVDIKIDCKDCEPFQNLTLDILDGGNDILLYTGPVFLIQGKGEVRIPLSDEVDKDGLVLRARGEDKTLMGFIPGPPEG